MERSESSTRSQSEASCPTRGVASHSGASMPTSIVTLALYGCAFLSADGALNTVREVIRFGEVELPLRDLVVRHCLALVAFAVSLFLFKWRTIRAMRPVQFLIVALPAVALALIFIALALVEGLSSTGVFWVAAISCLAILL